MTINCVNRGYWCPLCKHKTERKLMEYLETKFDINFQFKAKWCKNNETNISLPFDFVIESLKIIIELDGEQHFSQVSNWTEPEKTQKRDKFKMECAVTNGYTIIRLLQTDVWNDTIDWKERLDLYLHKYITPKIIFIASTPKIYENHVI